MKASEVLKAGLAKLDGGKGWSQRIYGFTTSYSPNAGCAQGALDCVRRELGIAHWDATVRANAALARAIDTYRVEAWNDAPERTFADVEAAFQKAIELAEAEGN